MTQAEKKEIIARLLGRYNGIGPILVRDDASLCRLLTTLQIGGTDREIGDYLASFLTV